MQTYELLYIIPSKYTDKEIEKISEDVRTLFKETEANILELKPFEKRAFAYPIKHSHFGIYGFIKFETEKEKIKKLDGKLRLMPEIIRHQIYKFVETQRPVLEKIGEVKKERKTAQLPIKRKVLKREILRPEKEEKIKLEELDKKLEEILKE